MTSNKSNYLQLTSNGNRLNVSAIYQSIRHQIKSCDMRMVSVKVVELCYWQENCSRNSVKFGANLEQFTIVAEVRKKG